jgi:hypothetical protein
MELFAYLLRLVDGEIVFTLSKYRSEFDVIDISIDRINYITDYFLDTKLTGKYCNTTENLHGTSTDIAHLLLGRIISKGDTKNPPLLCTYSFIILAILITSDPPQLRTGAKC